MVVSMPCLLVRCSHPVGEATSRMASAHPATVISKGFIHPPTIHNEGFIHPPTILNERIIHPSIQPGKILGLQSMHSTQNCTNEMQITPFTQSDYSTT